jgi:predicted MFS family arabinose efflux permease
VCSLSPNLAPALGPVLGGVLVQCASWRWIFGLLAILSGICLLLILFFLRETSRFIVGNGSKPAHGVHRTLFSYLWPTSQEVLHAQTQVQIQDIESDNINELPKTPSRIPNPLVSLKMLLAKDTAIITLVYAVYYTTFSCIQASLSPLFITIYGFSELETGLIYIPFGVGAALGSWLAGKVMNRDYRLTAKVHGITINAVAGDDLTNFPIEKARFRSVWYSISISGASVVGYGWSMQYKTVRFSLSFLLFNFPRTSQVFSLLSMGKKRLVLRF